MTKRQKLAARFNMPVESFRFIPFWGWLCSNEHVTVWVGRSLAEIQSSPSWQTGELTWLRR